MKNIFKNINVKNGIYLYVLQIFNTVIPLLTIPYITRVLGIDGYGVFTKTLNIISYFQAYTEYGFTLTGARKITLAESREQIDKIVSNIISCKAIIAVVSFAATLAIGAFTFTEASQMYCLLMLFLVVVSEIFMMSWVFQGLQDMKYITIVSVIARTVSIVLIFMFVKTAKDLMLYAFFYAITYVIIAILGQIITKLKFNIRFIIPKFGELFDEFREGWYLFTTSFAGKVCAGIGITALGIYCSDTDVGGYSAVLKIPQVLLMVYAPIGQILYPMFCKTYGTDARRGVSILKKTLAATVGLGAVMLVSLILLRRFVVNLLFGDDYLSYSYLIPILSLWLILSIVNNLLGIQVLVARGYQKQYSVVFLISIGILTALSFILGYFFGPLGIAIATLSGELILTVMCSVIIIKNRLLRK